MYVLKVIENCDCSLNCRPAGYSVVCGKRRMKEPTRQPKFVRKENKWNRKMVVSFSFL